MDLEISKKQNDFIKAQANEVLFGGAAGGGKSYGQLIDALLYALKYPKSKQLILRRSYPELEKSLIRVSLDLYPNKAYKYNTTNRCGTFVNGSKIDFGYCDSINDVYKYQSAEYDVIRFDELTHFEEEVYVYIMSRLRGANSFPKQMKSSTNPGGIGHTWVKSRFILPAPPSTEFSAENGTRIFIPSKVQDNKFLMEKDPEYVKRLLNLSENDQKALLYGDWDIFEGQYFDEWDRDVHVIEPFDISPQWKRYIALDYGLDMLACYFIAVDNENRAYVYKEIYKSGLIVSDAASLIRQNIREHIYAYIAPPDLWNRRNDTGKSATEIFAENGIPLVRASNDRVQGWYNLKEWLKPYYDNGVKIANLRIFKNCTELIRCLPSLQHDKRNPDDVSDTPHELTHAPDALRYFVSGRPAPAVIKTVKDEEIDNFINYGRAI